MGDRVKGAGTNFRAMGTVKGSRGRVKGMGQS